MEDVRLGMDQGQLVGDHALAESQRPLADALVKALVSDAETLPAEALIPSSCARSAARS